MKAEKLPEPKFYTVQVLAEKLGCTESDILNYALTGQLDLSVESQGWTIEYGSIEEDDEGRWFSIPEEIKKSRGDFFKLSLRDQKDLVRNGFVTDPSFQEEGYAYASATSNSFGEDVTVHLKEVIVLAADLAVFLNESEKATEENEAWLKSVSFNKEKPLKSVKAVDCIRRFYEEGIEIYAKILKDTSKEPSLKTVIHTLRKQPEFSVFPYETIKRHMSKKELILRFQNTEKG